MAGTQKLVEQAINWVCATRLPVGADVSNCVAGIDIRNLSTRSTVYCRENELGVTPPIYRWFPESLAVADGLTVILPITLSPAQPGRWRVESSTPPPSDCCTAAETPYDDGLVPPPLGVGTVQGAIDILKVVSVNLAADVVIAQNTANAAGTAAAAAQTSANTAITNAATAQTAANNAQTTANAAGLAAAAAQTTANNAQTDATAALAGLGTKADKSITLTAGAGMTGGGDLSANRTFDVGQNADGSVVVNANDIQVAAAIQSGAAAGATAVQPARTITAGNGLTGGGDLSSDRTLSVQAADASIAVAAGGVSVGVLQTDAQHGNRGGGALHADVVAAGASGFMSGADKTKLDGITAGAGAQNTQTFNYNAAVQTWTRPAGNYKIVRITAIGSGAGGGGAAGAAAGSGKGGAGGGGSAARLVIEFKYSDIPANLYITVPDGGAGGNGSTNGNGNNGVDGGLAYVALTNASTIAANLVCVSGASVAGKGSAGQTGAGGAGGGGGTGITTISNVMNYAFNACYVNGKSGVAGSGGGTPTSNTAGTNAALSTAGMIMGGTGGGGSTNGDSKGGDITATANTPYVGLAGGAAGANPGNAGTQETGFSVFNGGTGGGSSNSVTGGKGGDGTQVGAGGGGGGGGTNTGGAGGKGGPGQVVIECF